MPARSAQYRVQRDFDRIDVSDFKDQSYLVFKEVFARNIDEINQIDGLRARLNDFNAGSFGCTLVNTSRRNANGTAHITVHRGGGLMTLGDIYYSFSENARPNNANGWFNVGNDGYEQFLTSSFGLSQSELHFSAEQAAEHLWAQFVVHAGLTRT